MKSLASHGFALRFVAPLAAVFALAPFAAAAESCKTVDEAVAASKKTGKAIFTLLGSETCPPCERMRKDIEGTASWQGVLSQYVYLHIDVNKEQEKFQAWEKLYPSKISGTPHVAVISSDGRIIHNQAGSIGVKELTEFLTKNGKLLTPAVLAKIKSAVEAAQKALDSGDVVTAVSTINPVLGSGGAGEDVQNAEAFAKKLADDAKAKFTAAEEQLKSPETSLTAAVDIVRLSREYTKLTALAADLKKLKVVQNHKDYRDVFEQAKLLDQAALKSTGKDKKDAIAKYEMVARKWPNSAASKYASEKLAALGSTNFTIESPASTDSSASKNPAVKPAKGPKIDKAVAQRTAKSLLDTAETLSKINPVEAKKKAEQVVELVPGTELAKKAEALIKTL